MSVRSPLLLLWLIVSCQWPAPPERHDWTIIPGTRIGPIGAQTSERDLVRQLGAEAVVRREIGIGEGLCTPGTMLYPATADAVHVTWIDSSYSRPAVVEVRGRDSRWRTPAGVRVGIPLSELEAMAGAPIEFTGFGWDYGGIGTWSERTGRGSGAIVIGLSPDSASQTVARQDPRYSQIVGEQTIRSDHPLIRALTIHVVRIFLRWGEPKVQRPCPGG